MMRGRDWSNSPLGDPRDWPQSLRSIAGLVLESKFPMFVAWGPDLGLVYNDSYSHILGAKHPGALGRRFADVWPEVWSDVAPLVDAALAGESRYHENLPFTINRHGHDEATWFTFSFSPVRGEDGQVAGLFCACAETTAEIRSARRQAILLELDERLRETADTASLSFAASELLGRALGAARVGYGSVDPEAATISVERNWFAEGFDNLAGVHRFDDYGSYFADLRDGRVVAVADVEEDGRTAARADAFREIRVRAHLDVPVVEDGRPVGQLFVHSAVPRDWSEDDILLARAFAERMHVMIARRATEARYRTLFETVDEGFCVIEFLDGPAGPLSDYVHVDANAAYEANAGIPAIVGKRLREVVSEAEADAWAAIYRGVLETGEPVRFERELVETGRHLELAAFRIEPPDRRQIAVLFKDVTARRQAEARLRASEARLRTALEIETVGAVYFDMDGRIVDANEAFLRMGGYDREDLESGALTWQRLHPPEWADVSRRAFAELKATGRTRPYETEYLRKDGTRWWALFAAKLLPDGTGFEFALDITERKLAEQKKLALVELSDRIRDIRDPGELAFAAAQVLGTTLGASRVGYAAIDPDLETLHVERDWNAPGVETLAGRLRLRDYGSFVDSLKRGELIAIRDVHDDERTAAAAAILESNDARAFVNVPVIERGRLSAVLYVNQGAVRDWTGEEIVLIREVAERTLTAMERLRAEAELRALNDTLEAQVATRSAERDRLWNLSEDMLARADYSGMMSAVSPAWKRVLGWTETELLSRGYASFMHPDDMPPTLAAIAGMAETRQSARFENRIATRDGDYKSIEWTVVPEPDGVNFIAVGRDLSATKAREAELERTQEALRQSQKMEAMGSLTGGVAHDFNNLLTPIVGALDLVQRKRLGTEREQRLVAGAMQSADRAKTLVQRLLAFARRQPLQSTSVDLAPLVRGMADLVSSTTGPQIKVVVDAPDGLPPAKADPNQLEMAILNLAVNARDAMPDGGTLRISVDCEPIGSDHRTRLAPGRYLRLSVADTGVGMDEATLARAAEPFFSTKGVGKGTGLGLSMVHGLASQLGGALTIHSKRRLGTHVELWLPRSAEAMAAPDPAADAPDVAGGTGTVLLVDDEEIVRLSTADMLTELGYAVVEASSAEQAIELVEGGLAPDLLVTDHMMPGLSGTELARIVQGRRPDTRILIVSGYADSEGIAPDLPRLTKPFRNADLAASLAAIAPPRPSAG